MYDITTYGASTGAADNSGAINAAINAATAAGGGDVLVPAGRWKVTNSITLKPGVTLRGEGNVIYNFPASSISGGSIIEVNHTNVAIFQQQSSTVDRLGFDYPAQDPNASSPINMGATIQLAGTNGNLDQHITRNWFHKAYLAMDLRGNNGVSASYSVGGLVVDQNEGSPIYGLVLNYMADWGQITNNKFNAGKMNTGALTTGLVAWAASNSFAFQLEGNDWVTLEGNEVWGYNSGCVIFPGQGYGGTGPYNLHNCSFDACVTGVNLLPATYNQVVRITDCQFTPFNNATGAKGAAVSLSNGVNMSNGGFIFTDNYIFGPFNQVFWAGNASQSPSNMIIVNNVANAAGGNWAIWSDFGNNVQVRNNVFRGFSGGLVNLGSSTNTIVTENQS